MDQKTIKSNDDTELNQKYKDKFIGPRALYDKFYIPDRLVDRKKEEHSLFGLLNDAVVDQFSAQISLFGLKGVGKTVLINKSLKKMTELKSINYENNVLAIYANCEGKDLEQILFTIINSLAKKLNYDIDSQLILSSDLKRLWNLCKLLISKLKQQIIIFLDSVEYLNPNIINKVCNFAKTESIIVIQSYNIPKSSPILIDVNQPDYKLELGIYSNKSLLEIGQDRCKVAIKNPVEDELLKYVVDLTSLFDKKVPGSIMKVLRDLYPILEHNRIIDTSQVRDVCRYQFEGFSVDELGIADFISNSDILERVFLDNICGYFIRSNSYYISSLELQQNYQLACESLEESVSAAKYQSSIKQMQNISLLLPSTLSPNSNLANDYSVDTTNGRNPIKNNVKNPLNNKLISNAYFITISPEILNEMLNVAFGSF